MATAASMPFICPASCTSIRIASGGPARQAASACSPLPQSPTTRKAPVAASPAASAGRSRSLSSTRSRLIIVVLAGFANHICNDQGGQDQDVRQHGTYHCICVSFFALCERKKRNTKEDEVPL